MSTLADDQAAVFFLRSYTAVDGLWFMKVEEQLGFEAALEIDAAVWSVMPKIQARALKTMTGQERGLAALHLCLTTKLHWEGYAFEAILDDGRALQITIRDCPWRRLLHKSGREHLAERIGRRICGIEYAVWAAEFGEALRFKMGACLCAGEGCCELRFADIGGGP